MKLRKALRLLREPAYRRALRHWVGATTEHEHLRALPPLATVIDIGANRGQFSLTARHLFPAARIVAFEPLPGPAARYREVFASDPAVQLHQLAIGPEPGEALIHVAGRDASSSLLPIGELQGQRYPGTGEVATLPVRVARLDAVVGAGGLPRPALLKLDVQGFELAALRGCEPLERFDWIYAELAFVELYRDQPLAHEVIGFLAGRGFGLHDINNLEADHAGHAIQGDFLFRRL